MDVTKKHPKFFHLLFKHNKERQFYRTKVHSFKKKCHMVINFKNRRIFNELHQMNDPKPREEWDWKGKILETQATDTMSTPSLSTDAE